MTNPDAFRRPEFTPEQQEQIRRAFGEVAAAGIAMARALAPVFQQIGLAFKAATRTDLRRDEKEGQ